MKVTIKNERSDWIDDLELLFLVLQSADFVLIGAMNTDKCYRIQLHDEDLNIHITKTNSGDITIRAFEIE